MLLLGKEGVSHTQHNLYQYFIFIIIIQTMTACSLEEPIHTLQCPSPTSIANQYLGVIKDDIYHPSSEIPKGYSDKINTSSIVHVCPITDAPDARYYDYCVLVEDVSTHERMGMACSFCPQDHILCNDNCTSVMTDPANCGKCNHYCGDKLKLNKPSFDCHYGHCYDTSCPEYAIQCEEPLDSKDSYWVYCVDPTSDTTCGATCDNRNGTRCSPDEICMELCQARGLNYSCECRSGLRRCNHDCIPNTEPCSVEV